MATNEDHGTIEEFLTTIPFIKIKGTHINDIDVEVTIAATLASIQATHVTSFLHIYQLFDLLMLSRRQTNIIDMTLFICFWIFYVLSSY